MIGKQPFFALFGTLCALALPSLSFATGGVLPGPAEIQRLHDVMGGTLPKRVPVEVLPTLAEPGSEISFTSPEAANIRFILNTVKIEGVTVFPPEAFMPHFKNMTGQETTVAEVYELANRATASEIFFSNMIDL